MREGDITINGINIHYADWPGEGKPVVCVHGLTANCRYFDSLGEKLSPQHRIIAYDLRGRGNSGKPGSGYNLIRHAADLQELLDALSIEKPVILGHSLGAAIVAFFAAHIPESVHKLVLVDGGGSGSPEGYDTAIKTIKPMIDRLEASYPSIDAYLQTVRSAYGDTWTEYAERVYTYDVGQNDDGSASPKMSAETAMEDFSALKNYDPLSNFSRIQCPTLFLWAPERFLGGPPIVSPETAQFVVGSIPDCKLVEVKGANHATILLGEGDATCEAMRAFLAE